MLGSQEIQLREVPFQKLIPVPALINVLNTVGWGCYGSPWNGTRHRFSLLLYLRQGMPQGVPIETLGQ